MSDRMAKVLRYKRRYIGRRPKSQLMTTTTPLASRYPRLVLLLLPTSPPPIFVAVAVIMTTGALRCVTMRTSLSAILTFLSRGEEGKEKTLQQTTHRIHPPLPIVLPPCILIPRYSAGDYVRCRKEDDASSPLFPSTSVVSQMERLYPPPPAVAHSEGGRCDLCWGNINEVATSVIHVTSVCYTNINTCVK